MIRGKSTIARCCVEFYMPTDLNSIEMDKLEIHTYPDPILSRSAGPITEFTDKIAALAHRMIEIMAQAGGIGLAAPQVGVSLRLIVMSPTTKPQDAQILVNPRLSNFQGAVEAEEGCLSVPDVHARVRRPATCTVDAQDLQGNSFTWDLDDMPARIAQHEIDHLDGTLFIDRLSTITRFACRKAIKQLEKQYQ